MLTLPALESYLSACRRKHLSPETIRAYHIQLRDLFASSPPDLSAITIESIEQFLDTKTLKPATLKVYLLNLMCFFRWCVRRGYISTSPFPSDYPLPRGKSAIRPSLSIEELTTLLEYIPINNFHAWRSHAIWNIIGLTGLRLSECTHIRVGDVTENGVIVRHAKGNKERMVPLPPRARAILTNYMPYLRWAYMRTPVPEDWLFPNYWRKSPLSRVTLSRLFISDCRALGIRSGYTVHCLRHTYATLLVRAGVGLPILQQLLGHASVNSTMIYLHISAVDTTTAALKHPLASL